MGMEVKNSKALPLEKVARSGIPPSLIVVPNQAENPQSAESVKIARFAEFAKLTRLTKPVRPTKPTKNAAEAEEKNLSELGAFGVSGVFGMFGIFDRETVEDLADKTAKLLSAFDRELRYEIKTEADVVQIEVIDNRDGDAKVVRKIPMDEVIKLIKYLKTQIDDRDHVDIRI